MSAFLRRRAFLCCAVLLVAQLLIFADYFTDDSYIYARFATNLVEGNGFVFNPGERVHAATSPLWALLVAGIVGAGLPLVASMKVLGGACAVAALAVASVLGTRRLGRGIWRLLFLLLLATEPWFVRWSASGMETPLASLLLLVALEAGLRDRDRVAWGRLGWSVGLLPLVRPETILLWGLVALAALRAPGLRRRVGFWAPMSLPLIAWTAFAWPYYGHLLPATLQAKSTPLGFVPSRLAANLSTLVRLYGVALALPGLAWCLALLRRPARLVREPEGSWLEPALWTWTVVLPVVYLVRDVQVVSRYLEVVFPVVLVLGLGEFARARAGSAWRGLLVGEAAAVLLLTVVWIAPSANGFGRSLGGLVEMGEWLRANTGEGAVVAAYDIGAIGYASRRPILDLGGLVQPGINDLRDRIDDAEILHRGLFLDYGTPDWLVDRDPSGAVLDGLRLRDRLCQARFSRTVENLGLTRPEPVVYTLYRLSVEP